MRFLTCKLRAVIIEPDGLPYMAVSERMKLMEKIKAQFNQILPYFMVTLMFYYGGPLFMINDEISVFIMGVVLPIGSMLIGFVIGLREGFKPLYPILCLVAFIPQYWLNLPDLIAWGFYAIMYIGGGMLGMFVGWIVDRVVRKMMLGK